MFTRENGCTITARWFHFVTARMFARSTRQQLQVAVFYKTERYNAFAVSRSWNIFEARWISRRFKDDGYFYSYLTEVIEIFFLTVPIYPGKRTLVYLTSVPL